MVGETLAGTVVLAVMAALEVVYLGVIIRQVRPRHGRRR
jgi:hypothetical protein